MNLTDGFYMQFRVDEFSYDGLKDGVTNSKYDEWISISVSDSRFIAEGSCEYGNNWVSLIRGSGDGQAYLQSFVTEENTDEKWGQFRHMGDVAIEVPMDADDREIYELEITYGLNGYEIRINGVTITGMDTVSQAIESFENCYVGVSFHSGVENGVAGMTILKQGTSKTDAAVPQGAADKEPEMNSLWVAEIADPSTVPAGQPALLFDSAMSNVLQMSEVINGHLTLNEDGTWNMAVTDAPAYLTWTMPHELSYDMADFPVFTMLLRNYCGDDGVVYPCVGDVFIPTSSHIKCYMQWDDEVSRWYRDEQDEYIYITVDLSEFGSGRINAIQADLRQYVDSDSAAFDIAYMGFFRSTDEAFAYADEYLLEKFGALPDIGNDNKAETTEASDLTGTTPEATPGSVSEDAGATGETKVILLDPLAGCLITVSPSGTVIGLLLLGGALMLLRKKD